MGGVISKCMGSCWGVRDHINTENNNDNNIKHTLENKLEEEKYYSYFDDIEMNTPIRYYCHHNTKKYFTV